MVTVNISILCPPPNTSNTGIGALLSQLQGRRGELSHISAVARKKPRGTIASFPRSSCSGDDARYWIGSIWKHSTSLPRTTRGSLWADRRGHMTPVAIVEHCCQGHGYGCTTPLAKKGWAPSRWGSGQCPVCYRKRNIVLLEVY